MKILFSTLVFCMLAVVCAGKEVVWKTGGGWGCDRDRMLRYSQTL